MATRKGSHRDRATRVRSDLIAIDAAKWTAGNQRGTTRVPFAVRAPRAGSTVSLGSPQATMRSPPSSAPPTPATHAPQPASRPTSWSAGPPTGREPAPPQARHEFAPAPALAQTQPAPRKYAGSNAPPPSSCPDPRSTIETQPCAAQDPQSSRSDAAGTGPTDPAASVSPRANSPSTHQAQDDDGSTPTPCRHRSEHSPPAPTRRAAAPKSWLAVDTRASPMSCPTGISSILEIASGHIVSDRSSLSHARPSQNQTFLERGKLRPRSSDSVRADAGVWAVESAR